MNMNNKINFIKATESGNTQSSIWPWERIVRISEAHNNGAWITYINGVGEERKALVTDSVESIVRQIELRNEGR